MINIIEKKIDLIENFIDEYYSNGGCVEFAFYEIKENYLGEKSDDEYLNHLMTATQILELINYETNFHFNKARYSYNCIKGLISLDDLPNSTTDYSDLVANGRKISLEEFLGPYFDVEKNMPYIKGRKDNSTLNSYFRYTDDECSGNALPMNELVKKHMEKFPSCDNGFIYALIQPPYSMSFGETLKDRGEYVLNFFDLLFDNLDKIVVYKWSTDCNPYFNAGKEWWGAYFWTVYNPVKDIYIGIVASTTD
ncbi:hypothetical protein M2451_002343 [Dysgonomonas sp. PFB1-18]|uniref:hypothetical protein n=1 Tax=unclassified Dysgonomonas TaxID=2630389 RepID=UPI00247560D3|nr:MULTISPECIES: hypothetical protein [unclassified Dysgonomonas]MDL2303469.1 hypothetical protein [Dysgonomonas sp. OttesenSCG-928-D17]MDH6307109.1 hypothetical protein [Dysgonomonas sp. PF1-14]MDH6337028.1 hypothetical protein [Dysgonomonas sp. PF1-16]MDH6381014.1 hypothetical protein [Dysgonomonas sp. PFB1-18]MDH6396407.1 hypothetical protein [Dysgonomonas sp. PF1-23]